MEPKVTQATAMEPRVTQKGRFTISGTVPAAVESPNAHRRERASRLPTGMQKSTSGPPRMMDSQALTSPSPIRANPETYNTAPPQHIPENATQVPNFAPPPSVPVMHQPPHTGHHLYHQQSLPTGVGQLANTHSNFSVISGVSGVSSVSAQPGYGYFPGAPGEYSTETFATNQAAPEASPAPPMQQPTATQQQHFVSGPNNIPPGNHTPHLVHSNTSPVLGVFAANPNYAQQMNPNQPHVIIGHAGQQYRIGPRGQPVVAPGGVVYYQYTSPHTMQAQGQYAPAMHPSTGYVALPSYQQAPPAYRTATVPPHPGAPNLPPDPLSASVPSNTSQSCAVNNSSAPPTTATTPSPTGHGTPVYVQRMTKSKSGGFPANSPRGLPPRQSSEGGTRAVTVDRAMSGFYSRQESDTQNRGSTPTGQRGNAQTQQPQQPAVQSPRSPTGSVGSSAGGVNGASVHQIGRFLLTSLTPITSPTSSPVASPYATVHSSKPATVSIPHARYIKEAMTNPELTRAAMSIDPHELSRKLDEAMGTTPLARPLSSTSSDVTGTDLKAGASQSASAPVSSIRKYRSQTYLNKRRSAPIVAHVTGGVPGLRNLDYANQVLPEEPPESEDQDCAVSNPAPGSASSTCGYSSNEGSNQPVSEARQVPYSSTHTRPLHRRSQPPPSTSAAFFPNEYLKRRPMSEGQNQALGAARMSSEPLPLPPPPVPEVTIGEDGARLNAIPYRHPRVLRSRSEPPTLISVSPPTPTTTRNSKGENTNFEAVPPSFDSTVFGDFNGPQGLAIQHVYEEVLQVRQRQEQMASAQIEFMTWARQTMCHQQQHLELVERILTGEPNTCALAATFSNLSIVTPSPGFFPSSVVAPSPQPPPVASTPVPSGDLIENQTQISTSDRPRPPSTGTDAYGQVLAKTTECQTQSFDFTDSLTSQWVPSIDLSAINLAQTPMAIQDRKIEELAQVCKEQGKVSRLMLGRILQMAGGVYVGDPENMMDTITLLDIQNEALHRENDSLRQQLVLMQQQIAQISTQSAENSHGIEQQNAGGMTLAAVGSPSLIGW